MKPCSVRWYMLDQYKCALTNHIAHIHSHWIGEWVGRVAIPTYTDVLDWPQALLSRTFCHKIKHTASTYGLQLNKLKPHLKYTARLEGTTEDCKLQDSTTLLDTAARKSTGTFWNHKITIVLKLMKQAITSFHIFIKLKHLTFTEFVENVCALFI